MPISIQVNWGSARLLTQAYVLKGFKHGSDLCSFAFLPLILFFFFCTSKRKLQFQSFRMLLGVGEWREAIQPTVSCQVDKWCLLHLVAPGPMWGEAFRSIRLSSQHHDYSLSCRHHIKGRVCRETASDTIGSVSEVWDLGPALLN